MWLYEEDIDDCAGDECHVTEEAEAANTSECRHPSVFCSAGCTTVDFVGNYWCPDCGDKVDLESARICTEVCRQCNPLTASSGCFSDDDEPLHCEDMDPTCSNTTRVAPFVTSGVSILDRPMVDLGPVSFEDRSPNPDQSAEEKFDAEMLLEASLLDPTAICAEDVCRVRKVPEHIHEGQAALAAAAEDSDNEEALAALLESVGSEDSIRSEDASEVENVLRTKAAAVLYSLSPAAEQQDIRVLR